MSSPTKIMGPNLESVLNSAGFYRKARITTQEEWEAHLYEQGESKEEQKKADEADWSEGRIQCAAIRDAELEDAWGDAALVAAAYSNYVAACLAIDDRRDAAKAKREEKNT
jgi:hypothetical protein